MRLKFAIGGCLLLLLTATGFAREIHVAVSGDDAAEGTADKPLRTISAAAQLAQPGDTVIVHEGLYREEIAPPRGGLSDEKRITYLAAPNERVEIRGSEVIKGWTKLEGDVWQVVIPNSFFGKFNPYSDVISGDWFNPKGRVHHTGAVYLNGEWLAEAASKEDLFKPAGNLRWWFAEVDEEKTTIWAQFPGVDPNAELVEINVRQTVFYPRQPGCNYITVRGFIMRHAATPWAPPTAQQIGLIGTHWSKGWIIENNVISHSVCCGITLGKYGDEFDNTSANTAEGYVATINRALANGWSREKIGHHIVRNNVISHCEQAGIVGSLGPICCRVIDNTIHDIHVRRLFTGAEMAGIKFHAAIDTLIGNNHIYRTCRGLWLDWMAQGTRVYANLFHQNDEDLFVEVNHGPFVVDNNLFLSQLNLRDMSEGGAYLHNLFAGAITVCPEPNRQTPYHPAHSTQVAGLANIKGGDNRFLNNVFIGRGEATPVPEASAAPRRAWVTGFGLAAYDAQAMSNLAEGNVYLHHATPAKNEPNPVEIKEDPHCQVTADETKVSLGIQVAPAWLNAVRDVVTSDKLGKTAVSQLPYENYDGQTLIIDRDFFGKPRTKPTCPGPFSQLPPGDVVLQLVPR
ncbi:MAG: NosD domain-containing protein [Thermogutta sp.]